MPLGDADSMSLNKAHNWYLPCWVICGECDYLGCSVCSLVTFFPWMAQGFNRNAALGSRCWLWSIVLIICLIPIGFLGVGRIRHNDCTPLADRETQLSEDPKIFRVDEVCVARQRFNLVAIGICIAATVLGLLSWVIIGWVTRMHLRKKYNLPGHWCTDLLLWVCCFPCALCQETRTIMKHSLQDKYHLPRGNPVAAAQNNPVDHESVEDLPL